MTVNFSLLSRNTDAQHGKPTGILVLNKSRPSRIDWWRKFGWTDLLRVQKMSQNFKTIHESRTASIKICIPIDRIHCSVMNRVERSENGIMQRLYLLTRSLQIKSARAKDHNLRIKGADVLPRNEMAFSRRFKIGASATREPKHFGHPISGDHYRINPFDQGCTGSRFVRYQVYITLNPIYPFP
tara:strand:+ start:203 stop:754 length:552 start_codon:yes stop_codon:yes gene_type:complete